MDGSRSDAGDALVRLLPAWLDAFNRRESKGWVAAFHPQAEFRPSIPPQAVTSPVYRGHEGVARYLDELREHDLGHQARLRKLRRLDAERFMILTDVLLEEEVISGGAIIVRLEDGRIVEATAYLTDEDTLITLGILPEDAPEIPLAGG